MIEHAMEYAAAGWPIFPLQGKEPRTRHGHLDASTDETVVRAWWSRWPDANIGAQVARDLEASGVPDGTPADRPITGLDGKTYQRPNPGCDRCGKPFNQDVHRPCWEADQAETKEWARSFTDLTPCPTCADPPHRSGPLEWPRRSSECPWPHMGDVPDPIDFDHPAILFRDLVAMGVPPEEAYAATYRPEGQQQLGEIVAMLREAHRSMHEATEVVLAEPISAWTDREWALWAPAQRRAIKRAGSLSAWLEGAS